jgi:Family of unknown function (DUF5908)
MPVIIKELVISTTVDANAGQATTTPSVSPTQAMQKEVVQQCVEQVLTILKEKAER